jgi:hypothetical protein
VEDCSQPCISICRESSPWCKLRASERHQGIALRVKVRKLIRTLALVLLGMMLVASVISATRRSENANTSLLAGAQVSPQVRSTIDRSCRDCHSEATRYPWYSYIAPVSWFINQDVQSGREHLNFSRWSEYSVIRRERCLSEIANQVQDGGMPLAGYTFLHRDAKLSQADVEAVFKWTQEERARLIMENAGGKTSP